MEKPIKKKEDESSSTIVRQLAPYLNLSWQMIVTIGVMTWLGWWLDQKFHTSPWLLVVFTFLGATAGLVNFIRTAISLSEKSDRENKIKP